MILQALYRYYGILLSDPELEIAPPGYSATNVSFALNLSSEGELLDIYPFVSKRFDGKKEREISSRRMIVPEQVKRSSGINPNFMCDNSTYVLGLTSKEDKDFGLKRFQAFREHNVELLLRAKSAAARAVIAYLTKCNPETASEHPVIARNLEALLEGGNIIFWVEGEDTLQGREISRVWEEYKAGGQSIVMQCCVTGEAEPIARLHPSIQGVRAANPTGASLVGFNDRAYESYNRLKGQGLNSPTSQKVASGYGVALNYLLSNQNPNRKISLGDTTVIYWAENPNKTYANVFAQLINPQFADEMANDEQQGRRDAEAQMREVAVKVQHGQPLDVEGLRAGLDENTRFYVLGLASNAARLAVRFFLNEPFGRFVDRILQHYEDLRIQKEFPNQPDYLSPFRLIYECVSPKVTRRDEEVKASWSLMGGALMRSILTGSPYPEGLYTAIMNRIRHDTDDSRGGRKINYVRAAFIKAYLIRKYRRQTFNPYEEVLQMSLDESFTHPAYVLGRLFAVLEDLQIQSAKPARLDTTIKDRYFTSACATPANVFPVLLRLSQHHISKSKYGYASDSRIEKLMELLDARPFPNHFTLEEQGVFVLGYYHQRAGFYSKDNAEPAETDVFENLDPQKEI